MTTTNGRGLGWRRQTLDLRDHAHAYAAHPRVAAALPPYVDLRPMMPPVYDQGQLGSCVANATAALLQYERRRLSVPEGDRVPSRLMIYYGAREMEGTAAVDAGSEIRDAIKFVAANGTAFEDGPDAWPYDVSRFAQRPPRACYDSAYRDAGVIYRPVAQNATQLMAALAEGWPVAFGFMVYSGLDSDEIARNYRDDPASGRLIMPGRNERAEGGHAVVLVGYDYANRSFLVRNSWGGAWGLRGYFIMPFEYVVRPDLSSDFWTVQLTA